MNPHLKFHTDSHRRRSIRLKNYDYSIPNLYFITICTFEIDCIFGEIVELESGECVCELSKIGKIAKQNWEHIPNHFPNVELDEFIVMPNHLHGIIAISGRVIFCWARACGPPTVERFGKPTKNSIPTIIRSYKSSVTRQIRKTGSAFAWQRNYYEHIIRNEKSLEKIRDYIRYNSAKWNEDKNNPENFTKNGNDLHGRGVKFNTPTTNGLYQKRALPKTKKEKQKCKS